MLRSVDEWVFSDLGLMLVGPAGMYLIAHLIFPDPIKDAKFRVHYYGAMRPVWWLAVLVTVASTLFKPIAFGTDLVDLDNAAAVVMTIVVAGSVAGGALRAPPPEGYFRYSNRFCSTTKPPGGYSPQGPC